jgi:hypothetical protein
VARDLPDAGVPRASLAVDTNQVRPVPVKGPTLLAENDPYNAVKSTVKPPKPPEPEEEARPAIPVSSPAVTSTPEDDPTVLRAEPVTPGEAETADVPRAEPVLRAEPVDPRDTPRGQPPLPDDGD